MAAKKKITKKSHVQASPENHLRDVLRKSFGAHSALTVQDEDDAAAQIKDYFSTGIDVLDRYVIGCGGLPGGRMSETYSEEGAGKTSLAYSAIAATQRAGGIAGFIDPEYSFDKHRAKVMGVNPSTLLIMQPDHLEMLFEMVKKTIDAHDGKVPLLLVWDSIASMNTKAGYSLEAGNARVGDVPLLMSQELKKLMGRLTTKRAHFMMLNQIRSKIGVMFGSNLTTPGGNAPKFYSSVRLWIMGGKAIKNAKNEHTGKVITIMAAKNRLSSPWKKARVRFDYATGFNNEASTISLAISLKLISPRGEGGKKKAGHKAYVEACKALKWPIAGGAATSSDVSEPADESDDTEIEIETED